jgi:hypothetical protein
MFWTGLEILGEAGVGDLCAIKRKEKSLQSFNDLSMRHKTWQQVITKERADVKHNTKIRTRDSLNMYHQVMLLP